MDGCTELIFGGELRGGGGRKMQERQYCRAILFRFNIVVGSFDTNKEVEIVYFAFL